MARFRVMHIITELGTYGAERFLLELLGELRDPDLEMSVLLVSGRTAPRGLDGIEVFPMARKGRYDLSFLPRMTGTIRAWHPDIVHTHTHHGKYWGRLAAIAAGVPHIVHTEHNSEFEHRFPFTYLNRLLHARTHRFVAFSTTHGDSLARDERISRDRITVIANGIRLGPSDDGARERARLVLQADAETHAILHVGRLAAVKNQRLAIEAVAGLQPVERHRLRLYFVGDGDDRAALEGLAASLGIADHVRFLGYRSDVADLLPGADLWLMTSMNEAMPISMIEAMAAGVPIVTTPWLGAGAFLEGGVLGTIAGGFTAHAVSEAIRSTLRDPAATATRAIAAAKRARSNFSIKTTAEQHIALYRSLLA